MITWLYSSPFSRFCRAKRLRAISCNESLNES
jgi:hypothetical protein